MNSRTHGIVVGTTAALLGVGGAVIAWNKAEKMTIDVVTKQHKDEFATVLSYEGGKGLVQKMSTMSRKLGITTDTSRNFTVKDFSETLTALQVDENFGRFIQEKGFTEEDVGVMKKLVSLQCEVLQDARMIRLFIGGGVLAMFVMLACLYEMYRKKNPLDYPKGHPENPYTFDQAAKRRSEFPLVCELIEFDNETGKIKNFDTVIQQIPKTDGSHYVLCYFVHEEFLNIARNRGNEASAHAESDRIKREFEAEIERLEKGEFRWDEDESMVNELVFTAQRRYLDEYFAMLAAESALTDADAKYWDELRRERYEALDRFKAQIEE